jgi:hypothetical protein
MSTATAVPPTTNGQTAKPQAGKSPPLPKEWSDILMTQLLAEDKFKFLGSEARSAILKWSDETHTTTLGLLAHACRQKKVPPAVSQSLDECLRTFCREFAEQYHAGFMRAFIQYFPETRTQVNEEWLAAIAKQNDVVAKAEAEAIRTANVAKEAKKEFEAEVSKLRSVVRSDPANLPLFTQPANTTADDDEVEDDEEWRDTPIDSLDGIQGRVVEALANADIDTMGELVDFQEEHGDTWAQKVKGLGPSGQENLAKATEAFWENDE